LAQDPRNLSADRGNSSFDRRHRFVTSYLWELGHSKRAFAGGWQLGGIITYQSGQSYTPLNGSPFGNCYDPGGFGRVSTARPAIGNSKAPLSTVALLVDRNCTSLTSVTLAANPVTGVAFSVPQTYAQGYMDAAGLPVNPSAAHFIQVPLGFRPGDHFPTSISTFVAGSAGRNSLVGPNIVNWDFSILKNVSIGEGRHLQFRLEIYDLMNHPNPGNPIGNVFSTDAQFTPAFAFSPRYTAAGVTGVIPENAIDAFDPVSPTLANTFRSEKYMNTSSRRVQFGLKLFF
jgi:hypothetical protein